jgi:hypothetical protein
MQMKADTFKIYRGILALSEAMNIHMVRWSLNRADFRPHPNT